MSLLIPNPNSPTALGYRWPAEWEPHAGTWLSWPHNRRTWSGAFEPVPKIFAEFVKAIARFEPVHVNAGGLVVMAEAQAMVGGIPNVFLHDFQTDDAWCRDHGPIFLNAPAGQPPALVDWLHNAWGHKYPYFEKDNAIPRQIAELQGRKRFEPGIVLEGGSIEGNGEGTVITTEQCLLNPNRNPTLSREQIEQFLADYVGAKKVLWLSGGDMVGDDTDGHIDQLARFVDAATVVCAYEDNPHDANYRALQTNYRQLQSMTTADGNPLKIVPLNMPRPLLHDGDPEKRMPGSYCNFLIVNGGVLVPTFDDPNDQPALDLIASFFPTRQVIGLPAFELVWGRGTYHCLSQQEPV